MSNIDTFSEKRRPRRDDIAAALRLKEICVLDGHKLVRLERLRGDDDEIVYTVRSSCDEELDIVWSRDAHRVLPLKGEVSDEAYSDAVARFQAGPARCDKPDETIPEW